MCNYNFLSDLSKIKLNCFKTFFFIFLAYFCYATYEINCLCYAFFYTIYFGFWYILVNNLQLHSKIVLHLRFWREKLFMFMKSFSADSKYLVLQLLIQLEYILSVQIQWFISNICQLSVLFTLLFLFTKIVVVSLL